LFKILSRSHLLIAAFLLVVLQKRILSEAIIKTSVGSTAFAIINKVNIFKR
jgi:hypothetical protein